MPRLSGAFLLTDFVFSYFMQEIELIPFSESAVLLSFGHTISDATHQQLMQVKKTIEQNPFMGFIETTPAYNSLAVYYNPAEVKKTAETIAASVILQINQLINENKSAVNKHISNTAIIIPVCYNEEFGTDLKELSARLNLSTKEIIDLHSKQVYKVYMIGFTPGFPYMGILNERLFTKRKDQPAKSIASGSVAIAGNQTGIYPLSTPGGWNIIGRTPVNIVDFRKENPFLLHAGDSIQFTSITKKEFTSLLAVENSGSSFNH